MGRIVIFGAGGFGHELMTAARGADREVVFLDDAAVDVLPGVQLIREADLLPDDQIAIAIADGATRRRVAERFGRFATLVAPTAIIGFGAEIGEGAVICDFAMITARAKIGKHFQANIYSYVAHDCVIGDFVTFAPKVCCNGNVHIGDGAYIGTGAILRQGNAGKPLVIGAGAVIGMGAVVTKDVPAGTTVIGNPARPMEPKPA